MEIDRRPRKKNNCFETKAYRHILGISYREHKQFIYIQYDRRNCGENRTYSNDDQAKKNELFRTCDET